MLYIGSAGFLPSIVVHSNGLINPFHSQLFILGFLGNLHQKTATTNTSDNEEDRHSERHQTPYVFAHGRHRGLSASPMVYGNLDPKVVWLLHYIITCWRIQKSKVIKLQQRCVNSRFCTWIRICFLHVTWDSFSKAFLMFQSSLLQTVTVSRNTPIPTTSKKETGAYTIINRKNLQVDHPGVFQ